MRALAIAVPHLTTTLLPPATALLRQLAQAALWGTLFALAVWVLCRLAPRMPVGLRCALWWLASLKLLLGLAWPAPLTIPLLPPAVAAAAGGWLATAPAARLRTTQDDAIAGIAPARLSGELAALPPPASAGIAWEAPPPTSGAARIVMPGVAALALPAASASGSPAPPPPLSSLASAAANPMPAPVSPWWPLALAALWLSGVARQLVLTAGELRRVRAFLARSAPVRDERLLRLALDLGSALGLGAVEVRTAPPGSELQAPLTAGALRPVVVLPAAALDRLSASELAMTLGHELMHARRRDLLWGWIPAAAARLFFFLPPAALAAREYALAREAACDAAVLRLLGAAPATYGRLLVRLGVHQTGGRPRAGLTAPAPAAATAGGAATSLRQLKRRLEMLQHQHHRLTSPSRHARLRRLGVSLLVALALAALVPMRIAAVTPAPGAPATASPTSITPPSVTLAPVIPATSIFQPAAAATAVPAWARESAANPEPTAGSADPTGSIPGIPAVAATRLAFARQEAPSATGAPADADAATVPNRQAMASTPPPLPDASEVPPVPPAPPIPPAPPAPPVPPDGTTPPAPPIPPMPPTPPTPPTPPEPPADGGRGHAQYGVRSHSHDAMDDRHHGDPYVLLQGRDEVTMSGDTADVERARQQQRQAGGGDLLWLRRAGREYVIRDAATLREVREIFRPQAELGARQGELGAQQGELGARQGELGSRQGALGAQQGKLGAEQARLAAEQAKLTAEAIAGDDRQAGAREQHRDQLAEQQVKLAGEMRRLGDQQRELGHQQRELGEQQRRLGDQQRELGSQQRSAAREADAKLHALLDQAIAGGAAKEVK
jgi:beta-lactamase regulating signal transducer with metallopeptidase domain